ncbi:hypothetical protein SVIOM342S_04011 [Streptomyces violaceorubidus]
MPPDGFALLPLHPWQFRAVLHQPDLAGLLDAGLVRDLGAGGAAWHPTSSVRTVHRSGAPAMLKLSLAAHITNSRRENLRKELHRGVEVHRLLRRGLSRQWRAAHPDFDIVRDPAWLAVDGPDGTPVRGLDVVVRHNPFRPSHDVCCVASRRAEAAHPRGGRGPGAPRNRERRVRHRRAHPAGRGRHAARRTDRPPARSRRRGVVPALPPPRRTSRPVAGRPRGHRPGGAPAEHARPAGRRRLARGRPLPRQPGLLLPRVPAHGTRRPAARDRSAQRHVRGRRGHRRALRLLPRRQQRVRSHRRLRFRASRRGENAAGRLPPLPRRAGLGALTAGVARSRRTSSTRRSCAARRTC